MVRNDVRMLERRPSILSSRAATPTDRLFARFALYMNLVSVNQLPPVSTATGGH